MAQHVDGAALGADAAALLALLEAQPLCDDGELAQALEAAKRSLALRFEATRDPRWLLARCFVVERCVSRLIASCSESSATDTTARFQRCAFLLENALATDTAKWLFVLLGVLALVDKHDSGEALQHLRSAAECSHRTSSSGKSVTSNDPADGVLLFWLGVALFKNGHVQDSVEALEACLQCNYAPIASLNLAARVHLSDTSGGSSDLYAASLALQRALEVDTFASVSMVNYATLLGHMQSFEPQQQMLVYYQEALALGCSSRDSGRSGGGDIQRKRSRSGSPKPPGVNGRGPSADRAAKDSGALLMITEAQAAAVLAPHASHVADAMVTVDLAYAALENGDWEQAKQSFEALLALDCRTSTSVDRLQVECDYIFVLLQSHLFALALETCDRTIASLQSLATGHASDGAPTASPARLLVFLYKADALLSLERVDECARFLKDDVEPLVRRALEQQQQRPHHSDDAHLDEIAACHVQLINNLAVATACHDDSGVDAAIAMLRAGIQLYPSALSLTFNLVLLLWRQDLKDAACAIWFEARAWSHRMDARDWSDWSDCSIDSELMALVATAENAAIAAAARSCPQVSEHVSSCDDTDESGVSLQQLLYLDALVLNHWGSIQSSRAIQTSVRYIEYLDALRAPREL